MNICAQCGAPMVQLLTSQVCKAECDLKPKPLILPDDPDPCVDPVYVRGSGGWAYNMMELGYGIVVPGTAVQYRLYLNAVQEYSQGWRRLYTDQRDRWLARNIDIGYTFVRPETLPLDVGDAVLCNRLEANVLHVDNVAQQVTVRFPNVGGALLMNRIDVIHRWQK